MRQYQCCLPCPPYLGDCIAFNNPSVILLIYYIYLDQSTVSVLLLSMLIAALHVNYTAVTVSPSITSHHTEKGSAFPTTPISTAQHDSGFDPSSEATNSPFNFEMHSNIIQQLTKSPGDGFLFQGRTMFDSSVDRDKEQVS